VGICVRLLAAGRALTVLHTRPQVDHPNCIKLHDVYITPRKVYIVTELVTGGELLDRCVWQGLICTGPHGEVIIVRARSTGGAPPTMRAAGSLRRATTRSGMRLA
jgi:hypothetical protein